MKIELINISIQEISNEYEDKLEEGVSGYSERLDTIEKKETTIDEHIEKENPVMATPLPSNENY